MTYWQNELEKAEAKMKELEDAGRRGGTAYGMALQRKRNAECQLNVPRASDKPGEASTFLIRSICRESGSSK